jgi:hypothetical protein
MKRIITTVSAMLASVIVAQGTAFTYQGMLSENGAPVTGTYDLEFELFESSTSSNSLGIVSSSAVPVSNGCFHVLLDFGSGAFDGSDRWLEMAACTNGGAVITTLVPRQQITATPYAIHSESTDAIINPGFIGTTTSSPLELHVNNVSGLRLEYPTSGIVPNLIGGDSGNTVSNGVEGAVIAGGSGNTVLGDYGSVLGGIANGAWGLVSTAMGHNTLAIGDFATAMGFGAVAAGEVSTAMGSYTDAWGDHSTSMGRSTSASGVSSTAMGMYTVASGSSSTAMGSNTTASGWSATALGRNTAAIGNYSTAMGNNTSASGSSSVAMGLNTQASSDYSTAMGFGSDASGEKSTAMGFASKASGESSTAMGDFTEATGLRSTAMGYYTDAYGDYSTAMGYFSVADDDYATAMGYSTTASGLSSTAMGHQTTASGRFAVAIGNKTRATADYSTAMGLDTLASGGYSTAMGRLSTASGGYCLAAGRRAKANHIGTFVWADSTDVNFSSTGNNQFLIRAYGGVGIGTADPVGQLHISSAGEYYEPQLCIKQEDPSDYARLRLDGGGSSSYYWELNSGPGTSPKLLFWNGNDNKMWLDYDGDLHVVGTVYDSSSRTVKEGFESAEPSEILDKVLKLPLVKWSYKQDSARHIGPMSEDFHATFGLGENDKSIATVDADGVALAAIQGLNEKLMGELARRDAENVELRKELDELKLLVAALAAGRE